MTVKEFSEILKKYPSDMPVVVSGYEGGWDDAAPDRISKRTVARRRGAEACEGRYEEPDLLSGEEAAGLPEKPFEALTIARES